ncbi:hypothetical protein A2Z33_03410 [Candidatus Gottesmanbacteria bacterium RBG_16_52_11]|uniref:Glycosyltransferase 2-like domain-containing protein n=1 Tax=Candidatus Gottesmanbacteria bacterium RBG_16_52_11 TaxID=1798374 RepID=A0A1F5YW31_9BACT|nr:MAG: hypothetical protein A2Z33_03410 [Candidatus Gottesmanbacteria bacterium RBG_16_52_11]
MFTIVIPALNEESFLPNLLDSLAAQTSNGFRVIVVDGSSRDRTVEVAKSYADRLPGLQVIVSRKASLPLQRNIGARAAKTNWLIFSDADNVLLPYAVERMEAFVKLRQPQFFTTWIQPDSEVQSEVVLSVMGNLLVEGSILLKRSFSPGPLTAITHDLFNSVGGYNERASWGEDMEFANRVTQTGAKLEVLRETIYVWSMRRFRKQGAAKVLQQIAKASVYALLTKRALTKMDNYEMGGQLYRDGQLKKRRTPSLIGQLDSKIRKLTSQILR